MKTFGKFLLPLLVSTSRAEDTIIKLDTIDCKSRDYGSQLIEKFGMMLKGDGKMREDFERYEQKSKEEFASKYAGARAQSLVLSKGEHHLFDDSGGWEKIHQAVVIYYSFAGGVSKGQETNSGVFALFEISGKLTFSRKEGGLDLIDDQVM